MKLNKSIYLAALVAGSLAVPTMAQAAPFKVYMNWHNSDWHNGAPSYRHDKSYGHQKLAPHHIKRKLWRKGFRSVSYVKPAKHGDYLFRALDRRGRDVRLRVHNTTGEIVVRRYINHHHGPSGYNRCIPWQNVKYNFHGRGFNRIRLISSDDTQYRARALNRHGERVQLRIDARTGALQHIRFVDRDEAYRYAGHEPHRQHGRHRR